MKILYLGHRDGSEVMVAKDSAARVLRDLRGKTFAIPSRYSNQNLVIHKLMEDQGFVRKKSSSSRCRRRICRSAGGKGDRCVFRRRAIRGQGGAGWLRTCPLLRQGHLAALHLLRAGGHEDLIKARPAVVRDLVRGIAESGEWAETHRTRCCQGRLAIFSSGRKTRSLRADAVRRTA